MPNQLIDDAIQIEFTVKADIENDLKRLSSGIQKVVQDSNSALTKLSSSFSGLGRAITNAMQVPDVGTTFINKYKKMFDEMKSSSKSAYDEVKKNNLEIEKSFIEVQKLSAERVAVGVRVKGKEKQLEMHEGWATEAEKKAKQPGATPTDAAYADLWKRSADDVRKKLEALTAEYNNIGAKQKEVFSQIYLNQGQLANTVISNLTTNAEKAVKTIKDVVTAQTNELNKLGKISPKSGLVENIKTVKTDKGTVDFAGKELEKLYKVQRDLEKSQLDAMKMQVTAYTAYQQQTDAALRESNRILWEQSIANVNKYEEAIKKLTPEITKLQEKHKEAFKLQELNIETLQNQYKKQGPASLLGGKGVKELDNEREQILEKMRSLYLEQTRITRDYSKSAVHRGEQIRAEFQKLQSQYTANRDTLTSVIRELQNLTKNGILNADKDIVNLQKLAAQYDKYVNHVKTNAASLAKMTTAQEQGASKGFLSRTFESVRNFRWQYAAIMYIVTQAARAIEHLFVNALEKVGQFRTQIYSIAASISMSVVEPMSIVFDKVFAYSEQVMTRLTVASTKSYASLEDLVILTKTFAQAGIVPVKEEDFEKIALVGTAIKILTEDMVNSGTQMRQELYAFIQGRARATDQLAMMFKILGKNLKEEMKTWEKEGKNVLDGLAGLLSQFGPINKRIAEEYTNQVKLLKEMLSYIQRIALTDFVKYMAKEIKSTIALFGEVGGKLTPLGQAVTINLKTAFEASYIVVKSIAGVIGDILKLVSAIINSVGTLNTVIGSDSSKIQDRFTGINATLVSMARAGLELAMAFRLIVAFARDLLAPLRGLVLGFSSISSSLATAAFFATGQFAKGAASWKQATDEANEFLDSWGRLFTGKGKYTEEALKENEKAVNDFIKSLDKLSKVGTETFDELGVSIIKSVGHLTETGVEVEKLFQKITAHSGDKLFQIHFEMEEPKKKLDEWFLGLQKAHEDSQKWLEKNKDGMLMYNQGIESGLTPEESWKESTKALDSVYSISEGTKKQIEQALKYYVDLYNNIKNKEDEYFAQKAKKESDDKQEYMNYLFNLQESHLSAYDKLDKQTEDYYKEIQEKALTNKYFHDNLLQLEFEINERYLRAKKELDIKANDDRLDIIRSAYGKELTALEKIKQSEQDLLRKLDENDKIREEEKAATRIEIAKGTAEKIKKLEQDNARTLASTQAQTLSLQAKLLSSTSISPADKQKAQIMEIVSAYKEQELQIEKNIEAAEKQFGDDKERFEAYKSLMYEQLAIQKQIAESQIKDIQEPFWAKMKEMAQGWADSIADALTDMTLDFKNWKKTLNDLFNSISKDVIKAFYKTSVTDPLMSALTGKSEGGKGVLSSSSNSLLGLFGGKGGNLGTALGLDEKGSQVDKYMKQYGIFGTGPISSTNPLPVMVTNMGGGGGFLPSTTSAANIADLQKTFKSSLAEGSSKWFPISDSAAVSEKINVGMEFLTNKGLSVSDASAMLGNAYLESGLKTTAYNAKEGAYGIFQHRLDRLSGLKGFAGSEIDDYVTQLEYGWKELNTSHKKALEKMQEAATTEEKTLAFRKYFEVASPESDKARISYAKQIEDQYLNVNAEGTTKSNIFANAGGTTKFLNANVEGSMSKVSEYASNTTDNFKQISDYSGDTVVDFKDLNSDYTKLANTWEDAYVNTKSENMLSSAATSNINSGVVTDISKEGYISQMVVNAGSVSVSGGSVSGMPMMGGSNLLSGGKGATNLLSGGGLSSLFGGGKNTSSLVSNSSLFGGTSNILGGLLSGITGIFKSIFSSISNLLSGVTSLVGNIFSGLFGGLFGTGGSSSSNGKSSGGLLGNLFGGGSNKSGGLLGNLFGGGSATLSTNEMTVNAEKVSLSSSGSGGLLDMLLGKGSSSMPDGTEQLKAVTSTLKSVQKGDLEGAIFGGIDLFGDGESSSSSATFSTKEMTVNAEKCEIKDNGGGGGGGSGGGLLSGLFGGGSSGGSGGSGSSGFSGFSFSSLFSGGGGGGSAGGGGDYFAGAFAMAEGGVINEPILGKGIYSGKLYTLGEDESELVIPNSKLKKFITESSVDLDSSDTVQNFTSGEKSRGVFSGGVIDSDKFKKFITEGDSITDLSSSNTLKDFVNEKSVGVYGGHGGLKYAEGGMIGEPVVGKGLYTGQSYTFGENEPEIVVPQSKLIKSSKQSTPQVRSTEYHVHMGGIAINSIDTQTGTDFLVKNSDVIQGMMIKQLKNNKQIRRALPNSY